MSKDKLEYRVEDLEKANKELIRILVYVCEEELAKRNGNSESLRHAAVAVRESILTFLSLVSHK